jgi:hypothetical protein
MKTSVKVPAAMGVTALVLAGGASAAFASTAGAATTTSGSARLSAVHMDPTMSFYILHTGADYIDSMSAALTNGGITTEITDGWVQYHGPSQNPTTPTGINDTTVAFTMRAGFPKSDSKTVYNIDRPVSSGFYCATLWSKSGNTTSNDGSVCNNVT